MRWLRRLVWFGLLMVAVLVAVGLSLPWINSYQKHGTLTLTGLSRPVKVMRDEKAMAYLYAQDLRDAIFAQGFVTAQDRFFQMHLTRLVAQGRISELVGEKGKPLDIRMRTIGIHRNARKHAQILDEPSRKFLQRYADGSNEE